MTKFFTMTHDIDSEEVFLHKKSAFCRCKPQVDIKEKLCTHNTLSRFYRGGTRIWEKEEIQLLRDWLGTDIELAAYLKRTLFSIRVKRSKLRVERAYSC